MRIRLMTSQTDFFTDCETQSLVQEQGISYATGKFTVHWSTIASTEHSDVLFPIAKTSLGGWVCFPTKAYWHLADKVSIAI